LHGAALLSSKFGSKAEIAKKLRTAYDGRSSAAHGSKKRKLTSHNEARIYLADAIGKVLELYEDGTLDPSCDASKQIENIILNNAKLK